jgi:sigma-B regulation protein RsbU (phosphoserine phosphatase)
MRTFSLPNTHWHSELDYNAFCQCAYEYRGNFYDFIPQDGSGLSISFGDLPFTGEIQPINVPGFEALVRGLSAGARDDVAGLAHELNSVLHLLGPCDLCVPWFYARIDPARRQLQYVNAGHEAPLLIRQGSIERLERTGAALGLSTRAVPRQKAARIEAGDLLAIFSEAVSEDAVLRVVDECPQAGTAELAQRVLEVSRGSGIGEDLSFAAVRVVGACRHPLLEGRAELALCAA